MPATRSKQKAADANGHDPDIAAGYNRFKTYNGTQYTGMKVGRSHKWYYDKGEWRETKVMPDRWEITYSVTKRRAGKAPEGSGVPVGTGYHWFILAHQFVHKLNANDYSTSMTGIKLKLAHMRAGSGKWNRSEAGKRRFLIEVLEGFIEELRHEPEASEVVPLDFTYKQKQYQGFAVPLPDACHDGVCDRLDVILNDKHYGVLKCTEHGWRMTNVKPQSFVNAIAQEVFLRYE